MVDAKHVHGNLGFSFRLRDSLIARLKEKLKFGEILLYEE